MKLHSKAAVHSQLVLWMLCLSVRLFLSSANIRPDAEGQEDKPEQPCICQVAYTSILQQNRTGQRRSRHAFDCLVMDTNGDDDNDDGDPAYSFRVPLSPSSDLFKAHQNALHMGEWWIEFPCAWKRSPPVEPTREMYEQIQSLSTEQVKQAWTTGNRQRGRRTIAEKGNVIDSTTDKQAQSRPSYHPHSFERRLSNVGVQSCVIVIVDAADVANPLLADLAEEYLYVQSSSQYAACSNGAMRLAAGDDTRRVTLPNPIGTYNQQNIAGALFRETCKAYGYNNNCHLAALRGVDHVLFSLPYGLQNDEPDSFWAFASTGDYRRFSVYSGGDYQGVNAGFFVPSTLLHEIGHNYRLGHAFDPDDDGDDPYGDETGQMGGGPALHKCFNGFNYYVLGWHGDQTNEIELQPGTAHTYHLVGIDDLDSGNIVNIKVAQYYITFNLKVGINREIDRAGVNADYPNEVLIHEGLDIPFRQTLPVSYQDTRLVGHLAEQGELWKAELDDGNLLLQLCSIDTTGYEGVILSIGLDDLGCDRTPGTVSNPMGMSSLTPGETVAGLQGVKNEVFEFRMDVPHGATTVSCHSWGGRGDIDLFMNFASAPQISFTPGVNTCASGKLNNDESCTADAVESDILYMTIHAFTSFKDVSVTCTTDVTVDTPTTTAAPPTTITTTTTTPPFVELEEATPVVISAAIDEGLHFVFRIPPDSDSVECSLSGGTGDADLYTRWGSETDFTGRGRGDCAPLLHGNEETCSFDALRSGTLFLGVFGYRGFENVRLSCDVVTRTAAAAVATTTPAVDAYPRLRDNTWDRVSGLAGESHQYAFDMPSDATGVRVRLRGGTGDADLYAAFDRLPVVDDDDADLCVRRTRNNDESCRASDLRPLGNVLYVTVYGASDFADARVKVRVR